MATLLLNPQQTKFDIQNQIGVQLGIQKSSFDSALKDLGQVYKMGDET